MSVNMKLLIPFGYQEQYKPLDWIEDWLLEHHHPEYVRRTIPWLHSKGGLVGVGGGWRADGTQPDKFGFAPEGRSFHQNQRYSDGFIGAAALDLVSRDGPDANFSHDGVTWAMVAPQGGAEAKLWGVHNNVGSEPWHHQPIEIDGWLSWMNNGCPAPRAGYKLPIDVYQPPAPKPVGTYTVVSGDGWYAIARKTNTNVNELLALNGAKLTTPLYPGMVLKTSAPAVAFDWTTAATPPGSPMIRPGMRDEDTIMDGWPTGRVSWLQGIMGVPRTGVHDAVSVAKLKELQKVGGLYPDGIYGPQTALLFLAWRKV